MDPTMVFVRWCKRLAILSFGWPRALTAICASRWAWVSHLMLANGVGISKLYDQNYQLAELLESNGHNYAVDRCDPEQ